LEGSLPADQKHRQRDGFALWVNGLVACYRPEWGGGHAIKYIFTKFQISNPNPYLCALKTDPKQINLIYGKYR
jgi:hypothetical protein